MTNDERIKKRSIQDSVSIIQALRVMDKEMVKLLFIFHDKQFVSILTIGDIQRSIINDINLDLPVSHIVSTDKIFVKASDDIAWVKQKMHSLRAECMPVVDERGDLENVYFWKDLFGCEQNVPKEQFNIPVVIMAGGKGTRLAPITNIYPKPLVPVGEKTIVETIMDKFVNYGCNEFLISVNYKADMIKNYFEFIQNDNYHISYFQEDRPLGTAGSLRLLKDKLNTTFFVSNCDTMIYEDFASILSYHRENRNELTVVAAMKTLSVPYGTIITGENGLLQSIEEKPSFSFKINVGLYILEPSVLNEIPDDFFHITHLMTKLSEQGRRVGVYPISQNDWMDMGDWNEYLKLIRP